MPSVSTTRIRLNDQTYELGLSLFNPQGVLFPINTDALVSLNIEEDSQEWFKTGTLTINNKENIIERRVSEFIKPEANYKFRNDGRDLLLVNIKPVYDGNINTLESDPFPSEGWELNYMFSIYDVEDVPGNTLKDKNIKLYFWEYDYHLFAETATNNWDTNTVLYNLFPDLNGKSSSLKDSTRKVPTGLAIKSLISATLDTRSKVQTFAEDWDPGSSTIFYSSPTNNNSIEDLDYLFNRHVASKKFGATEGDVPLLFRDRYSKKWFLTSLSNQLSLAVDKDAAGPLQLEQFYITTTTNTGVIIPSLLKTPQSPLNTRNLNLGYIGAVNNFQFVDMSPLDNAFGLISFPCSSNNIRNKQFNLDVVDNSIENIKAYFQDNYVDKFTNNKNPTAMFSLNKSKTQNLAYKQAYSYGSTKIERYADSRNLILKTGFFLNQCLNFTVPGSTVRRANVFIGLDRKTGSVDADFDEKLLGQWYVLKVTHNFTQAGYTNNITAVKPHADKDIRIKEDIV